MNYKSDIQNNNINLANNNIELDNILQTIQNIPTFSDTNVQIEDVIDGKTYYSNGMKRTGIMNNVGQQVITPSLNVQNITRGYHNGLGYVEAVSANIDQNILPNNIKARNYNP